MLGAVAISILGAHPSSLIAEEPAEEFVKALVDARYYDIATEYLESAATSELVSPTFRASIPYERAKMIVRSASTDRSPDSQEKKFNQADQLLSKYASQLADPLQKINVLLESANIKIRRAEIQIRRSSNDRLTANEKESILKKADALLRSSLVEYQEGREGLRTELSNFQLDPEDPKSGSEKRRLERQYVSIRTQVPLVTELLADTLPVASAERKKLLTQALKENESVYDKYKRVKKQAIVFEAAINGGRAAQKLGDHAKALKLLGYVFEIGNGTTENRLKKKAFAVAVDSWDKISPYPYADVIKLLEKQVARLNRSELKEPIWERVQLELARAQLDKAASVREAGGAGAAGEAKALTRAASKMARTIARSGGSNRDLAKALIESRKLSFSDSESETADREIKSFDDAKDAASEMITAIVDLQNEVSQQKRSLRAIKDPAKQVDAKKAIQENQEKLNAMSDAALALHENALAMVDQSTDRADINSIRYYQSLCYYAKQMPLQSALIAEFLLDKYPKVAWTRQASVNIVKGYSDVLSQAKPEDREYESQKLTEACEEICNRWPGSNESAVAAATIVQTAIRNKDIASAETFFKLIPDSFSGKATLAAALGEKLWVDYRTNGELDEAARQQQLGNAAEMLQLAVSRGAQNITFTTANAALTLTDVLLEQNKIDEAVKQLEDSAVAPLDLIEQKNPAVTNTKYAQQFRQHTWRTAIKTYLAATGNGGDAKQAMAKATGVISAMQGELKNSNDPKKAAARLNAIYRSVGNSLKEQYEGLQTLKQRKQFAGVLANFVGTIEQGSTDTQTVMWAGRMLLNVAEKLSAKGANAEAAPLFKQALSASERAKKLGVKDPNAKLALAHLQALAFRGSDEYQKSVDQFADLLKEKPALAWQIDAAETLQMWGKSKQDANAYAKAMMGTGLYVDGKRKKNAIWGWRKLVEITRGNPKYNDQYRTAIYNSVKSRFEYGVIKQNKKAIKSSYSEINKALERFKFLTAGTWGKKFNTLVAEIKKAQ